MTALRAAIKQQLPEVVKRLCEKGANMNLLEKDGNCPLWLALELQNEDIASILVSSTLLAKTQIVFGKFLTRFSQGGT